MSNPSPLSPQVVNRIQSFCDELATLAEQCLYMADFNHTGYGYNTLSTIQEEMSSARRAIAESVGYKASTDKDACPLRESCHYLTPVALREFLDTSWTALSLLRAIGSCITEAPQRLAYEYMAYILEHHRDTARFILETVIEELPPVEGMKALNTLQNTRFA